ncbi:hypothetical protein GWK47_025464 [Chionoecetes opilio]|uniref:Uncharacterized protein n=1 Tax=Chionoecetes opilio TaxID=41210 RepID=A0A8J8WN60_CHIOP|nr:hypothetical protein GWK47_025464 [Chionoecetes opilio]
MFGKSGTIVHRCTRHILTLPALSPSVQQMEVMEEGEGHLGIREPLSERAPLPPRLYPWPGIQREVALGLQMEALEEQEREVVVKPLVPEYGDVLDLLITLPDALPSQPRPPRRHTHRTKVFTSSQNSGSCALGLQS